MIIRLFFLVVTTLASFQTDCAADESIEPPLAYTLQVDKQAYSVTLGKPFALKGSFNNPSLLLQAASTRRFSYGGIAFDYPASFGWEADIEGENYKSWTLSGNDFKIMYFRLATDFTPQGYASGMLKKFKGSPAKAASVSLGKLTLNGLSFGVESGGIQILNEAYQIPVEKGSGLIVFQDSPEDGASHSEEAARVKALLNTSFAIP